MRRKAELTFELVVKILRRPVDPDPDPDPDPSSISHCFACLFDCHPPHVIVAQQQHETPKMQRSHPPDDKLFWPPFYSPYLSFRAQVDRRRGEENILVILRLSYILPLLVFFLSYITPSITSILTSFLNLSPHFS